MTDLIIDNDGIMHKVCTNDEVITILQEIDTQLEDASAFDRDVAKVQRYIRDKINILRNSDNNCNKYCERKRSD